MTRAVVSTWHNFTFNYPTPYHDLYYEHFLENLPLWKDDVDAVYLIDNNWNFTDEDKERAWNIKKNIVFFKSPIVAHYYGQLSYYMPQVKEDQILVLDNDCFIFTRDGITDWFDKLGNHDAVVCWNNIGGLEEPIKKKYPHAPGQSFYSNHYAVSHKFSSILTPRDYWCETTTFEPNTYLPELEYHTKKGDWTEGKETMVYKLLERNDFVEMPIVENQGWHHLHSVSWAYILLSKKKLGIPEYLGDLKALGIDKGLKIMSWFLAIDTKHKYSDETVEVIKDMLHHNIYTYQ